MNNKPVAYGMLTFCKNCGEQNPYAVKELTELDYAEFLPIWKDFIKDAGSVLNVQMVAHHFYNLALRKAQEK